MKREVLVPVWLLALLLACMTVDLVLAYGWLGLAPLAIGLTVGAARRKDGA